MLPLMLFALYPSPIVLGQEKQQNYNTSNDILICQVMDYIESPIGSNMQQVSNICSYQNSIGHNQSIAELCFIFSAKGIDIINTFCDETIANETSTPVTNETSTPVTNETSTPVTNETSTPVTNEINDTLNSQNNTDNGLRVTIFDGISNFFSNAFNR
ncbi:protein of unknown function [Candidatus Nitrosocosmicus franklandus]|uniref:Uncharacterized protein n=2 Tax=Candidatus Nitrosocosmicus franklandianus TaxID=1798806 RepID=A0A484IBM6_9ARCH|nr:protein of unknown function [Candidatus Nitrosocosmicus franklandus]